MLPDVRYDELVTRMDFNSCTFAVLLFFWLFLAICKDSIFAKNAIHKVHKKRNTNNTKKDTSFENKDKMDINLITYQKQQLQWR